MPNGMQTIKKDKAVIRLPEGKKAYFISDVHLGSPDYETSLAREKKLVRWLESIENETQALFLVGDIFDFWFDYKRAVPKYFTRFLGQLARMSDRGIEIHFFYGNHDMWLKDYFGKELGLHVHSDALDLTLNDLRVYIAHGDGLGPGERTYKLIKKIFRNRFSQWLYRWLHPDIGIALARYFSYSSRNGKPADINSFLGPEKEHLILYAKEILKRQHYDYFIFGHRHHTVIFPLTEDSTYINLGDWIEWYSFAVSDGKKIVLDSLKAKSQDK